MAEHPMVKLARQAVRDNRQALHDCLSRIPKYPYEMALFICENVWTDEYRFHPVTYTKLPDMAGKTVIIVYVDARGQLQYLPKIFTH